jgi:putative endonuclease
LQQPRRARKTVGMHHVYMLRSDTFPDQTYIGYTTDLSARLHTHNSGGSAHTSKFRPWSLVVYLAFSRKFRALEFEIYLKSHSGNAFAAKRLW